VKVIFLAITLMGMLVIESQHVQAQMYGPYPYAPYWDGSQYQPYWYAQQNDPYYDLHAMHYQLYRQPYGYPIYQPCCYAGGIPSLWSAPIITVPQVIITPRPRPPFRRR
jgi:hypothetical protein